MKNRPKFLKFYAQNNPENFSTVSKIWDFKTAYYLLHPDTANNKFPDILSYIRQSAEPAKTLAEISGKLESEIEAPIYGGIKLPSKNWMVFPWERRVE